MDKKVGIILLVVIILIGCIGYMEFNKTSGGEDTVVIGDATFKLPSGYHVEASNASDGSINISNGDKSFYLLKYDTNNVEKCIKEYLNYKKSAHYNITVTNTTVGNVKLYKSTIAETPDTVHYWFKLGKKVYSIYSWDKNEDLDNIVADLITNAV